MINTTKIRALSMPLLAASSMLLLAAPAYADSSKAFAVGGGDVATSIASKHFAFSAHLTPNGPSGYAVESQVSNYFGNFKLQGPVTCVTVSGTVATIGIKIVKGDGTAATHVGEQFYLYVQGNNPGSPGVVPNSFDNSGYTGQAPSSVCPSASATGEPVAKGNIEVSSGA